MNKKRAILTGVLLGATALFTISGANAADLESPIVQEASAPKQDNFYISFFGGANIAINDIEFANGLANGAGVPSVVDTELDTGFTFGGAVGYKWRDFKFRGITPRTELEVSYFDNDVDSVNFSLNGPGQEVVASGSQISGVNIFGNLLFDWENAFDSGITPYVGGGVGISIVNNNIVYNGPGLNLNDSDTAFAWNIGAGASYNITERASLFVDARYQQIVDLESTRRIGSNAIAGAGGGDFEDDFSSILVRAGISVGF